jgi:multicomponent K+:H+ antiporter subunit D
VLYEQTLLKTDEHGQTISVQPFDSENLPETKYGGESLDANAHLIPYVIHPNTLEGEHISDYKQRQIQQQNRQEAQQPSDTQLKPAEP